MNIQTHMADEAKWEPSVVSITQNTFHGYPLSKDTVNLIYIPVGRMSQSKITEYMKDLIGKFKEMNNMEEYKFLLIPVPHY